MMRTDHQAAFEQLMADLDGELTPAEAASVRAHVAQCPACQEVELELRGVSGRIAAWTVGEPPASVRSPAVRSRMGGMRRWVPIAAALVLAAGAGTIWLASDPAPPRTTANIEGVITDETERKVAEEDSATARSYPDSSVASHRLGYVVAPAQPSPLLARTARLTLVVTTLDAARAELDRITSAAGGYVGQIRVSDERGAAKRLSASLQVPEASLDPVLEQLKRLGRTRAEGRDAEDVTQQSADLDARLNNARTSEKRLVSILANRTGDVTDVLNVEREIARVRGEIEEMEASRRNLDRRITYATIQLEMAEEAKAELGLGDQSLSGRLRNAAVEGWNTALDSVFEAALFIAQVAPTMMLWGLALVIPYRMVRRRLAR